MATVNALDTLGVPIHLRKRVWASMRRAEKLWQKAHAAWKAADRQAFYRHGVAAVEATNAWRALLGWQPQCISEYSRAVADECIAG